ncbi:DUF6578 domain-containing protein [Streptomyces sp. XD-27]|uniref:DUF6578 domain-containing protein n=1 Tax=Streptomyces sp. XD-27 TaxID=3062779 RepID=UPI0026F44169|nr:DUF6578 domain-containing protein [Streptomyces sp. XD-27]WKX69994.1 hypothetical protein Q3Y56_08770 [Streptomyces sp. XD-27]
MIRTVFYEDWEMECCGTPFSVGDEVTWNVVRSTLPPGQRPAPVDAADGAGELFVFTAHSSQTGTPATLTGRVRRIQVVIRGYRASRREPDSFSPVPGDFRLRPVDTCPKWFKQPVGGQLPPRDGRAYRQEETGVLVELEDAAEG